MEANETREHVEIKELDYLLQSRITPRYRSWLPLATQQLRLRSLIQIIGCNLRVSDNNEPCLYYYTLHRTSMSSPIYTSEHLDNANPRWASIDAQAIHSTGLNTASEIIVRLWRKTGHHNAETDTSVFAWSISFSGLIYLNAKLPNDLSTTLKSNSLVFHMNGGYFAPAFCHRELKPKQLERYVEQTVNLTEIRDSYTVSKLSSLRNKMQALKQQSESVQKLRERIMNGTEVQQRQAHPNTYLNRLLQPKRASREKQLEISSVKKRLEIARFRAKLLEEERARKMAEIRLLNQSHSTIAEENQDHGSDLMEKYRLLNKEIERLNERRQSHVDFREIYLQTINQLAYRRRQLVSELNCIYPIEQEDAGSRLTINSIHLPDSEQLDKSNDTQVAVALGYVAHATNMIAHFLNVPTRYPILHCGSRSKVVDHINDSLSDNNRQFPLFARSKDKMQFNYAVYLLNKNIAQLKWYCGLPTLDLRATLANLASLIDVKPIQSFDDSKRAFSSSLSDIEMDKSVPHKVVARSSMAQFKSVKATLGSSLDQGLNRPSRSLNSRSRRICKSEEVNLDDKNLMIIPPQTSCEGSSDETLNETILFNDAKLTTNSHGEKTAVDEIIEIMIPVSVTKPKNSIGSLESAAYRQRSSNSISSCEMALGYGPEDSFNITEARSVDTDSEDSESSKLLKISTEEDKLLDNEFVRTRNLTSR